MVYKAVLFDFMGTLARFVPEQEDLLVRSAAAFGIAISSQDARRGFASAADWWNRQLFALPLDQRSDDQKQDLYREFDARVMRGAGVSASPEIAFLVFKHIMSENRHARLATYGDVVPALRELQRRGVTLGVVSNMDRSLPRILQRLEIDGYFSVVVSSGEVGMSKPDPGLFLAAIARTDMLPEDAVYVGDQYENDVVGARNAGLFPILIDRYDLLPPALDATRIRSLAEVLDYVQGRC